jgi:hypothetical protein
MTLAPWQNPGGPPTTPTFAGTPVPGVAGASGDPSIDANAKAQDILKQFIQMAQRKQMANTAVPSAIPGMTDPREARNIGMGTSNPHAWGFERLAAGLSGNIKNAVARQKQSQLAEAEGDWSYLNAAMNEKFTAEQNQDQAGVQAAEQKIQGILGNPKTLKNMAKALNQDWLNPEKTTVYGEALKRVASTQQKTDQQNKDKQGAAQGMKGMIMKLLGQKQQLQLTLDEQKRMAQEIEAKAPVTRGQADPKNLIEAERLRGEEEYHSKQLELEGERVKAEKEEKEEMIKERKQEHIDNLQEKYEALNAQMSEKQDALQQKTLEAKDRLAVQQEIAGMRKDQMEWQREIAEEKLGMAKTTKERKDWLTGVRSDLQKNLITAQKNQHMWGVIGSGAYDDAQERLQKLDEISGDVMDGSMSNKDAAQAIFGAHGGESHGGGNFKRNPDGSYSEQ